METQSQDVLRVHVLSPPAEEARSVLEAALAPSIEVSFGPREAEANTEVLVGGRPSRDQLEGLPHLRFVVVPYAGVPQATRTLLLDGFPQLIVCNLHHNAVAAAELAFALLLAAAKTIVPADAGLRRGDWDLRYSGEATVLLEGKTVLVLGLGAIGTRVASVCNGFGMSVIGVRRHVDRPNPLDVAVHPLSALGLLLPSADFVVVCLPLTEDTEGLIGDRELRALPSSAILVNVARGEIVDERALFAALSERRIAAAGLDVWYRYPKGKEERRHTLPSSLPFWELDNVVMSPHRGGAFRTEGLERRRMEDLARTLNAIAQGGPIPNRVDLRAGY